MGLHSILVVVFLLTPSGPGQDAEILSRTKRIEEVDARFGRAEAAAQQNPRVSAAVSKADARFLALVKELRPDIASAIEELLRLAETHESARRAGDVAKLQGIEPRLAQLQQMVEVASRSPIVNDSPQMASLQQEVQEVLWAGMVEFDAAIPSLSAERRRLVVEVRGLRGELRVAPRGKAPRIDVARKGFVTKVKHGAPSGPASMPPKSIFRKVTFKAPLGQNVAFVTPQQRGTRKPAVIWLHGGFDWGIGEPWHSQPEANDQSGNAFRAGGIIMMHPSLRGGNDNPGRGECMLGEVDDVIAAAKYLKGRSDVDPTRIYLGGHSTGATLALLVAEKTQMFRGVFALGPIANPQGYGAICGVERLNDQEAYVRSPIEFMEHNRTPTWVVEGEFGNADALLELAQFAKPNVRFFEIPGGTHFTIIRPVSEVLAAEVVRASRDGNDVLVRLQDLVGR